jgi:hypothetical protein
MRAGPGCARAGCAVLLAEGQGLAAARAYDRAPQRFRISSLGILLLLKLFDLAALALNFALLGFHLALLLL